MEPFLPWYVAGPLIGLIVPALLILRQKQFGISSSFSFIISVLLPKNSYFKSARIASVWQFHFALGLIVAGVFSNYFVSPESLIIDHLNEEGQFLTQMIYANENAIWFFVGGLLTGFGARFANGCTAGNCIMGVAQFSVSSIIATISFFVAGLVTAQFINPILFS